VKPRKWNTGAYRIDLLRDFLIKYDKYYKQYVKDPVNCPFVFVFTDKSYVDKGLGKSQSLTTSDATINKSMQKHRLDHYVKEATTTNHLTT
jgi:hypothetical protein